jgi:hypothetical protein
VSEIGSLYAPAYLDVVDVNAVRFLTRTRAGPPSAALAIDKAHNRLLAGDQILALDSLEPVGQFKVSPGADPQFQRQMVPGMLLVNPSIPRVYAVAWNGVMGGNDGEQIYMLDGETLAPLASDNSTTITAMVLDDTSQRVYVALTNGHASTTQLISYDALGLRRIASVALSSPVNMMALNPATHHLFVTHGHYFRFDAAISTVEVLDTRTLGVVTPIKINSEPHVVAVLSDRVIVATRGDTDLTLLHDCMLPAPPPATPLPTPTAIAAPP